MGMFNMGICQYSLTRGYFPIRAYTYGYFSIFAYTHGYFPILTDTYGYVSLSVQVLGGYVERSVTALVDLDLFLHNSLLTNLPTVEYAKWQRSATEVKLGISACYSLWKKRYCA